MRQEEEKLLLLLLPLHSVNTKKSADGRTDGRRPIKPCQLPSLLSTTGALQISLTQSSRLSSFAINHFPDPNQQTLLPPPIPPPPISPSFPNRSSQLLSDSAANCLIAPGIKVEHRYTKTATREQCNHRLWLIRERLELVGVLTDYTNHFGMCGVAVSLLGLLRKDPQAVTTDGATLILIRKLSSFGDNLKQCPTQLPLVNHL